MATPIVTITCAAFADTSTRTVKCSGVQVSPKRNIDAKPNVNPGTLAEVQTLAHENTKYTLQNVKFTGVSGDLSYADVLVLHKLNYDGTNAPTLLVRYGKAGSTTDLVAFDGTTTAIPVILENPSMNIDTTDSRDGYLPSGNLTFVETA